MENILIENEKLKAENIELKHKYDFCGLEYVSNVE